MLRNQMRMLRPALGLLAICLAACSASASPTALPSSAIPSRSSTSSAPSPSADASVAPSADFIQGLRVYGQEFTALPPEAGASDWQVQGVTGCCVHGVEVPLQSAIFGVVACLQPYLCKEGGIASPGHAKKIWIVTYADPTPYGCSMWMAVNARTGKLISGHGNQHCED